MTVPDTVLAELRTAAAAAADRLAKDISGFEVGERLGITDAFLVCSAPSERQLKSICDEIEYQLKDQHQSVPIRREGQDTETWVLLDYGHMVIHVQHEQQRVLYGLDRLYADVPKIDLKLAQNTGDAVA